MKKDKKIFATVNGNEVLRKKTLNLIEQERKKNLIQKYSGEYEARPAPFLCLTCQLNLNQPRECFTPAEPDILVSSAH